MKRQSKVTLWVFGYVDLKKKRVGYPSVMHFEVRLKSGPDDICNLLANFIQRTYADDVYDGAF
jgi:hypothetical protein